MAELIKVKLQKESDPLEDEFNFRVCDFEDEETLCTGAFSFIMDQEAKYINLALQEMDSNKFYMIRLTQLEFYNFLMLLKPGYKAMFERGEE